MLVAPPSSRLPRRTALAALAIVLALLGVAPSAQAARNIPIGVFNINDAGLRQGPERIYAIRFVVDRDTRIHRFFSGMRWDGIYTDEAGRPAPVEVRSSKLTKGHPSPPPPSNLPSDWSEGEAPGLGYGHGNGGTIRARLVPMKPNGTPNLGRVLAEETFQVVKRYKQIKAEFGFPGRALMGYTNFGAGAVVRGGVPYYVVYQNVGGDPRNNFIAMNSPTVASSAAGPNGRNTLDPNAPGAIMGLDPREVVAWSTNGGSSWGFGSEVGEGPLSGDYTGSGDDAVKLPWYAWEEGPNTGLRANQPFFAYKGEGTFTMTVRGAKRATTLTEAGGYAPQGESVGVVAVRNLRTGVSASTGSLGGGLARGRLSRPVPIAVGDSYTLSNTGTVAKAEGDQFLQDMGLVGPGKTPYETAGHGYDRAELFALPHPFYVSAPAPLPVKPRAPRKRKPKRTGRRRAVVLAAGMLPGRGPRTRLVVLAGGVRRGVPHRRAHRLLKAAKRTAQGRSTAQVRRARRLLRRSHRAKIQVRNYRVRGRDGWRTVGACKLSYGSRFRCGLRTAKGVYARALELRAVVAGTGRSRAVRPGIHRG